MSQNEPIVFLNGELIPESQAGIPIRDRGFIYGDAVFDAARTFNGVPFRLTEHVRRLYDSLRYVRIDAGIGMEEMEGWSRQVVEHNYPLLPTGQDMWVMQRVTRGVEGGSGDGASTMVYGPSSGTRDAESRRESSSSPRVGNSEAEHRRGIDRRVGGFSTGAAHESWTTDLLPSRPHLTRCGFHSARRPIRLECR